MSASDFNRPAVNRLPSLEIRSQIIAYEQIAQFELAEFERLKAVGLAEPAIRHSFRSQNAQHKANELRQVLALRRRERAQRSRFVYKALEAQKLAHQALSNSAPIRVLECE